MFKEKFIQGWRRLRKDMKPMTFPQKLDHLWSNYKEYAFTVLLVIIMIIAVISCLRNIGKQSYLSGVLCNVSISQEGHDYLLDDFKEKFSPPDGQDVHATFLQFQDPQVMSQVDESYNAAMGVIGQVAAKELDYIFMDQVALDFFAGQEMLLNLESFLTEEEQAQWKEHYIMVGFEDSDVREPLALDVSDMAFVKDCMHCDGKVYLAFAGNLPHPESTCQFWEYINAWEGNK